MQSSSISSVYEHVASLKSLNSPHKEVLFAFNSTPTSREIPVYFYTFL